MVRSLLTNFSRGEFGPELYGRVDIPQYDAGAKQIRNFVVQRYGGAAFRPGLKYVGELPATGNLRLVPFQYSIEQAYMHVLGDSVMKVAAGGGMVLEDDLQITGVTQAAQAVLTIAYHGMAVGEMIYLSNNVGMTELNQRFATIVAVPDANHITININTTTYTAFVSSSGTVRTGPPTPPVAPEAPPAAPPAEAATPVVSRGPKWWQIRNERTLREDYTG